MIFNKEKIKKNLRNPEKGYYKLFRLYSVFVDTGGVYPIDIYIENDFQFTEINEDELEFWGEAWILADYCVVNDYEVILTVEKKISKDDREKVFNEFIEKTMEEFEKIASDWKTFKKFLKERVFWDKKIPLFRNKENAKKYGYGVEAVIQMAKEVESIGLLPDGEDYLDVVYKVFS